MKIKVSILLLAAAFITLSAFLAPKHFTKKNSSTEEATYDAQFKNALSEINAFAVNYQAEKKHAYYYDASVFKTLLNQKNAEGIRIYQSVNISTGDRDVVLVAIDKNGDDILPADEKNISEPGLLYTNAVPCPAFCNIVADAFSVALYGRSTGSSVKKAGTAISYKDAIAAVSAYKAKYNNEAHRAFAYSKADINALLSKGAEGIRIYHAVDASSGNRILVLAKAGANEILNKKDGAMWLSKEGVPCPDFCSKANKLND